MNIALKLFILLFVCFIVFIAGALLDKIVLALFSIILFFGGIIFLIKEQGKKKKQKIEEENKRIEEEKRIERERRRIALLKPFVTRELKVAGSKYHKEECDNFFAALKKTGKLNKNVDYGMTKKELIENGETDEIFEFQEVDLCYRLEPEPDNEYDKNAIIVYASTDHEDYYFVGYIPKNMNVHLLKLLDSTVFFGTWQGRKYKKIETSSYGNDVLVRDDKDVFTVCWQERNEEYFKYHSLED